MMRARIAVRNHYGLLRSVVGAGLGRRISAAAAVALVAGGAASAQTTYYVAPCGDDTWAGTSSACAGPAGPKRTIQAAIDAAAAGDTVIVMDGVYSGVGNRDLDFGGRAITVRGQNGAAHTTIDCEGSETEPHRGFWFHSGEGSGSVLEGFTITGGYTFRGGAVLCEKASSPTIRECAFVSNTAFAQDVGQGGGGVYLMDSSPSLTDCRFIENFVQMDVDETGGGGVLAINSSAMVTRCEFRGNVAAGPAERTGGAGLLTALGAMTVTDCLFEQNSTTADGGGILAVVGATPVLVRCVFRENRATDPTKSFGGGYVGGLESSATLIECEFTGNESAFCAGAIEIHDSEATFTNCTFTGNSAGVTGATGVLEAQAVVRLNNCLVAGNSSPDTAGFAAFDDAALILSNCTLSRNTSKVGAGTVYAVHSTSVTINNSVLWGNAPGEIVLAGSAAAMVSHSNVQGGWPGMCNMNADPAFVAPMAMDFRLGTASPCIDAGDNTLVPAGVVTDVHGNPRFVDDPGAMNACGVPGGAGGSAIVDLGACEVQGPVCYANCDGSTVAPVLNVNDFICFQAAFAAGDPYANCDGSTVAPVLNVNDFICFQAAFAQGCP